METAKVNYFHSQSDVSTNFVRLMVIPSSLLPFSFVTIYHTRQKADSTKPLGRKSRKMKSLEIYKVSYKQKENNKNKSIHIRTEDNISENKDKTKKS